MSKASFISNIASGLVSGGYAFKAERGRLVLECEESLVVIALQKDRKSDISPHMYFVELSIFLKVLIDEYGLSRSALYSQDSQVTLHIGSSLDCASILVESWDFSKDDTIARLVGRIEQSWPVGVLPYLTEKGFVSKILEESQLEREHSSTVADIGLLTLNAKNSELSQKASRLLSESGATDCKTRHFLQVFSESEFSESESPTGSPTDTQQDKCSHQRK